MYVYTCKYMWWCPMCVMFNPRYDPNRQEYFSGVAQLPASFCLPRTFSLCVVFSPQVYNIMIYNVYIYIYIYICLCIYIYIFIYLYNYIYTYLKRNLIVMVIYCSESMNTTNQKTWISIQRET